MSDNLLNRFAARVSPESILDSTTEEDVDAFPSFAILRGARERAVCIELRKRTGAAMAIPYGMIHRFEFDGSTLMTMYCADGLVVKITGKDFNTAIRPGLTLFGALARYLVPWACEPERSATLACEARAPVVESIDWS